MAKKLGQGWYMIGQYNISVPPMNTLKVNVFIQIGVTGIVYNVHFP